MTDNEIIKALECCIEGDCDNCPWDEQTACNEYMKQDALDLINRQKAEIERLQGLLSEWKKEAYKLADSKDEHFKICDEYAEKAKQRYSEMFDEAKGKIKAEAVKEFAERLKEHREIVGYDRDLELDIYGSHIRIDIDEFDNLVKEMVGEG